jgi:hypothetical protein
MKVTVFSIAALLILISCSKQDRLAPEKRQTPQSTAEHKQSITLDILTGVVVLKVGVDKDGMLKQQVVHAYRTKDLIEVKLVVHAGATLSILESVDSASRVHFSTDAWTSDYKTTIKQSEAIGWIATDEIVRTKRKRDDI